MNKYKVSGILYVPPYYNTHEMFSGPFCNIFDVPDDADVSEMNKPCKDNGLLTNVCGVIEVKFRRFVNEEELSQEW